MEEKGEAAKYKTKEKERVIGAEGRQEALSLKP